MATICDSTVPWTSTIWVATTVEPLTIRATAVEVVVLSDPLPPSAKVSAFAPPIERLVTNDPHRCPPGRTGAVTWEPSISATTVSAMSFVANEAPMDTAFSLGLSPPAIAVIVASSSEDTRAIADAFTVAAVIRAASVVAIRLIDTAPPRAACSAFASPTVITTNARRSRSRPPRRRARSPCPRAWR